jgi:hypothetical protein
MNITAIRTAIYQWASAQAAPQTVVWADQSAPRPARPYVALRLTGPRRVAGQDEARFTGTGNVFDWVGHRELTLQVTTIGDDQITTHDLALKLHLSLSKEAVRSALYVAAGLSISSEGDVGNVTTFQDTTFEPRYNFDVILMATAKTNEDLGAIETVEINGEEVSI